MSQPPPSPGPFRSGFNGAIGAGFGCCALPLIVAVVVFVAFLLFLTFAGHTR